MSDSRDVQSKCGGPSHGRVRLTGAQARKASAAFYEALRALVRKYEPHGFVASWVVEDLSSMEEIGQAASYADGCPRCALGGIMGSMVALFPPELLRATLPVLMRHAHDRERSLSMLAELGEKVGHA